MDLRSVAHLGSIAASNEVRIEDCSVWALRCARLSHLRKVVILLNVVTRARNLHNTIVLSCLVDWRLVTSVLFLLTVQNRRCSDLLSACLAGRGDQPTGFAKRVGVLSSC